MKTGRVQALLCSLFIACATTILFWPVTGHDYLSIDDDANIYANPRVITPTAPGLLEIWKAPYRSEYLPVTYTFWSAIGLLAKKFGTPTLEGYPDPFFFHLANLVLHALNAILVFWILLLVFRELDLPPPIAALGALLFAWHPAQVEPVAWATGLKDTLSAHLGLLSAYLYLRSIPQSEAGMAKKALLSRSAATVLFALAILAKPSMVIVPVMLPLLSFLMGHRLRLGELFCFAGWLALCLAVIAVNRAEQALSYVDPSAIQRLAVASDALGFYLGKILFPWPLLLDYSRSATWVSHHWSPLIALLPLVLLAAALVSRHRTSWLVLACLFAVALSPTLGLIPFHFQLVSTVADRYLYFGQVIFALAAVHLWCRQRSWGIAGALVALLAAYAPLTFAQVSRWESFEGLMRYNLAHSPDGILLNNAMGLWLSNHGRITEGTAHLRRATRVCPDCMAYRQNLAAALEKQGRWAEAETEFETLISQSSELPRSYYGSARALLRLGRPDAAAAKAREGIQRLPDQPELRLVLVEALRLGNHLDEALDVVRSAHQRFPGFAALRTELAITLVSSGRPRQAIPALTSLTQSEPSDPNLHFLLGEALKGANQKDEAKAQYRIALRLAPGFEAARAALEH